MNDIMIIIIIIILIIWLIFNNCVEGFSGSDTQAIAQMASLYNSNNLTTTNMKVTDNIDTPSIARINGDWLRINGTTTGGNVGNVGRTALFGNLSINSTHNNNSGLSVGDWKSDVGQGNIRATGNITSLGDMNVYGKINFLGTDAQDTTDPYYFEKKIDNGVNHLRLTLNDDHNESFQIWGNSCKNVCIGEGSLAHKFDVLGNVEHKGRLIVNGRDILTELDNKLNKNQLYALQTDGSQCRSYAGSNPKISCDRDTFSFKFV